MLKMLHRLSWTRSAQTVRNGCVIIVACILTVIVLQWITTQFSVSDVKVSGLHEGDMIFGTTQYQGRLMPLLSSIDVQKELATRNNHLRIISVQKQYPHTLFILATLTPALAQLDVESGYYELAANGILIARKKETHKSTLPEIVLYQQIPFSTYQPGDIVNFSEILLALSVIRTAKEIGLVPIRIDISSSHMLALHTSDAEFFFTSEKDSETQLYQFQTIIEEFRKQGRAISQLDVRFDKPVVQFTR